MARTALTDSQCWLILTTPDTVPDDVLAATIGATASCVHAARWRFRRHGWTVLVSYGVCPLCTRPFTRQGHHASRRRYHDACRPLVLKQLGAIHEGQVTQSAWHVYRRGVDFGKQRIPPCGAQRDHRGIRRALSQREQMIVRVLEVLKSWIWPFAILASGSLQRQHPELGVHRGCTIGLPKEPAIPPNDTGHWGRW